MDALFCQFYIFIFLTIINYTFLFLSYRFIFLPPLVLISILCIIFCFNLFKYLNLSKIYKSQCTSIFTFERILYWNFEDGRGYNQQRLGFMMVVDDLASRICCGFFCALSFSQYIQLSGLLCCNYKSRTQLGYSMVKGSIQKFYIFLLWMGRKSIFLSMFFTFVCFGKLRLALLCF